MASLELCDVKLFRQVLNRLLLDNWLDDSLAILDYDGKVYLLARVFLAQLFRSGLEPTCQ